MKEITDYTRTEQDEDFFERMQDLALNYGKQIQQAREAQSYTRRELANMLNIKQSYLKNIEDQKMQPDVQLQNQLERTLDIDLTIDDFEY